MSTSTPRQVTQPPPGWTEKVARVLAIWERASSDETRLGLLKRRNAGRLLSYFLEMRP